MQVTGGGDGGISLWPLRNEEIIASEVRFLQKALKSIMIDNCRDQEKTPENFPRRVGILNNDYYIMASEQGQIWCVHPETNDCNMILYDKNFASYLLLQISPCRKHVALATISGDIVILSGK